MDIQKSFHMNGGIGDNSYSKNSSLQKKVAEKVKDITAEAIQEVYMRKKPMSFGIADLGCSSGPNTLSTIKQLVHAVENACRSQSESAPEFCICLNDLHTNDFNTVFQSLPELYRDLGKGGENQPPRLYVAAYPGTFYGRLFPDDFLHFVYSSYSLHWLSTVPPGIYNEAGSSLNKKSVFISERSSPEVRKAYSNQFEKDFSLFLESRSKELVSGGGMVLLLLGRTASDHAQCANSLLWELLYQSLACLVAKGEIEEEKLESYEVHFYAPSKEELEEEVRKEGSFQMEMVEMLEMDNDVSGGGGSYGVVLAKAVRSFQESMRSHHFGKALIMDNLFHHYATLVDQQLCKVESADLDVKSMTALLVLTKL